MNWQDEISGEYFVSTAQCDDGIWKKNKNLLMPNGFSVYYAGEWILKFAARMPFPCVDEMVQKRDSLLSGLSSSTRSRARKQPLKNK